MDAKIKIKTKYFYKNLYPNAPKGSVKEVKFCRHKIVIKDIDNFVTLDQTQKREEFLKTL